VRFHIGKVQDPRRIALPRHEVDRDVRGVGGLAVLFPNARRQAGIAHLPAAQHTPFGILDGDDVIRPGIGAGVALLAKPVRIGGVRLRVMTVMPVRQREPALLQQRRQVVLAIELQPLHAVCIGQHMRLAGQGQGPPRLAQVPAQRHLADGKRHAVVRRAV
jgi:hypothetical protein